MTDNSLATRLGFLQIDDETRAILREVQPLVAAAMPAILDKFYELVGQYQETARFFRDASHRRNAKDAQIRHWELILSGRFDDAYFQSSQRIGKTHQRIGLEPRWYIGGYSYLISEMMREIERKVALPKYGRGVEPAREHKGKMLAAITKAALLDMDLAISVYLDANMEAKQDNIDRLGRSFQSIVDSVSSASTELESTAQSLSRTAEHSVNLTGVVSEASDDASRNVQSVASATEELASSVGEISRQVQQSNQVAAMAVQQAGQANERIGALSEAASRIGAVIKLISDVAEQTNLLALNATIEAARAGAAGRGFAVVAQEVKALAAQTAKATEDIGAQIVGMQAATNDAVGSIRNVTGTIDQISQFTSAIAAAIEEQGVATQEIAQNIQRAATGTNQVNGTIREVNKGAAETGTASEQVLSAAQQLAQDAARLRQEIDTFLNSIRSAA